MDEWMRKKKMNNKEGKRDGGGQRERELKQSVMGKCTVKFSFLTPLTE